jgi:hypothetical protein
MSSSPIFLTWSGTNIILNNTLLIQDAPTRQTKKLKVTGPLNTSIIRSTEEPVPGMHGFSVVNMCEIRREYSKLKMLF